MYINIILSNKWLYLSEYDQLFPYNKVLWHYGVAW